MRRISPQDLHALLAAGGCTLLDVRTAEELALARLPGSVDIPLHELPSRHAELNTARPLAVLCHHGVRSETAARFLEKNGFTDVMSVTGGLDAWSLTVDAAVPRY